MSHNDFCTVFGNNEVFKKFAEVDRKIQDVREKSGNRTKSFQDAKREAAEAKRALQEANDGFKEVVGTENEEAHLKAIEEREAAFRKAQKRLDSLRDIGLPNQQEMDNLKNVRRGLLNRLLAMIVLHELEAFPKEGRRVLLRAFSVAVRCESANWDELLKKTLGFPTRSDEVARIGGSVIAEYFPADGGLDD